MKMEKYYFCYSTNLHEYLRYEKGIKFICTAKHAKTDKAFWLFEIDNSLQIALTEYNARGRELGIHNRA